MIKPRSIVKRVKCWSAAVLFAGIVLLGGCARMYQSWYLSRSDGKIRRAGAALAIARSNAERSAAYADRADAYADKALHSRVMKLIAGEEYNKLFDLALQDYNQAIALAPNNAETYYRRGNGYYSRASLDMIKEPTSVFLAPAKADFSRAVEKNPKNAMAFDMLGLTDASMGNWTQAIADFGQESALDPLQRFRLSDAYCNRGTVYLGERSTIWPFRI
jgi:tetratricopeptide (TPR) repeat protein